MSNTHKRILFVKGASLSVPLVQLVKRVADPSTIGKLHLKNGWERVESSCPLVNCISLSMVKNRSANQVSVIMLCYVITRHYVRAYVALFLDDAFH